MLKATFLNGIKASEVNLKVLSVSPSHQFDNVKRFSPILRDSLEERVSSGVGKVNNNVNSEDAENITIDKQATPKCNKKN